jgi:hypothetical protein
MFQEMVSAGHTIPHHKGNYEMPTIPKIIY